MSVIVTSGSSRIAYNVVRSLGQRGIDVFCADFVRRSMSFSSRYTNGHFVYPSPFANQEGFVQCLIDEIQRLGANILIPVYEETFLVAKHADLFSPLVSFVLPTYEQILIAHNKDRWASISDDLGIPVPKTYSIEELQNDFVMLNGLRYPVLIKPKQGGGAWGIQHIESAEALRAALDRENCGGKEWTRFFVQERIRGETHCVAMLFNRGNLRAKVAYRQLRDFPITGGQATMRVSIRSHKAEQNLQLLLENLCWHGVCQADFIVDEVTQIPYLIDMNPRLWGSLAQAIASDVDFPHLLYRIAKEGDVPSIPNFRTNVVTRWVGGELGAFFPHLLKSNERTKFAREFFWPSNAVALYDDFSSADPMPFLVWLANTTRKALRFGSVEPVGYQSLDGEWN